MQDLHIHMVAGGQDTPEVFKQKTIAGGVSGGAVFSIVPESYRVEPGVDQRWQARAEQIIEFCSRAPGFRPVFFIDPTVSDAIEQVHAITEMGIAGFKVICNHFYPVEGLKTYQAIAETGLPLIFHSGVLYNRQPSSDFNRPMSYEFLMDVKGLRFSLAHVSWPWSAELVALFGKLNYLDQKAPEGRSRMYFDITPGTPPIFRRDALRWMYMCGFNMKHRVLWGTDCSSNFDPEYAKFWADLDKKIMAEIAADPNIYRVPGQDLYDYSDIWELATEKNFDDFFGKK